MTKPRRIHTDEFKRQAIALMDQPDSSNEQVARELGVAMSLLYKWRKALAAKGDGAFPGSGRHAPQDGDELERLRREVAQLREERDFLRLAAAYFAKESPSP